MIFQCMHRYTYKHTYVPSYKKNSYIDSFALVSENKQSQFERFFRGNILNGSLRTVLVYLTAFFCWIPSVTLEQMLAYRLDGYVSWRSKLLNLFSQTIHFENPSTEKHTQILKTNPRRRIFRRKVGNSTHFVSEFFTSKGNTIAHNRTKGSLQGSCWTENSRGVWDQGERSKRNETNNEENIPDDQQQQQ